MQWHALLLMDIIMNPEARFRGRRIWLPSRRLSRQLSQSPSLRQRPMLRLPSLLTWQYCGCPHKILSGARRPSESPDGVPRRGAYVLRQPQLCLLSHGHRPPPTGRRPGSRTASATAGEGDGSCNLSLRQRQMLRCGRRLLATAAGLLNLLLSPYSSPTLAIAKPLLSPPPVHCQLLPRRPYRLPDARGRPRPIIRSRA
jgi:hypothetical protein